MGGASTLTAAVGAMAEGRDWTLCSGLQLDGYPFLPAVEAGHLRYATWHVMAPLRRAVAAGIIEYVPTRSSAIAAMFDRWDIGAALVRVSPPAADGTCSVGGSTGCIRAAVERAGFVIAEVDPTVPRTCGDSLLHVSQFDSVVESTTPVPEYPGAAADEAGRAIADRILELLPRDPVLQIGVGSAPESLVRSLPDADLGSVRFVGMATDGMVDVVSSSHVPPAVMSPDMMGTRKLLDWSDRNPQVEMHPSTVVHNPVYLSTLERLISINSALQIDLTGNVNGEVLRGHPISGVGGSVDFAEAASLSRGGVRIIALTAGTPRSPRIVPVVEAVTLPRAMVDVVVTEHGVARLAGLGLRARAEALIEVAHPECRAELTAGLAG